MTPPPSRSAAGFAWTFAVFFNFVAGAPLTYQYKWCGSICFDYENFLEGNRARLIAGLVSGAFYAGFGKEQKSWGYSAAEY
jgi:hypothetical protein